jgi:DHA1 family inner membrane transport protein
MFGGATLALAIGVRLGTFVGGHFGWRTAFYAVALIGTIALAADAILLPEAVAPPTVRLRRQLSEFANRRVVLALLTTMIGFAGQIVAYTYLTPFLERVSGFRPDSTSALLVAFGAAAAVGTFIAGPAMDRYPRTLPALGLAALAAVLALMTLTGVTRLGATLTLIAWGATSS